MANKKKHSKARKKFQKDFIHNWVYSMEVHSVLDELAQTYIDKYDKLTDDEFYDEVKDLAFGKIYAVGQWIPFQDYEKAINRDG